MSVLLDAFDPTSAPSGTLKSKLNGGVGTLLLFNLSSIELKLNFDTGDDKQLPAWTARRFDFLATPCRNIIWTQQANSNGGSTPPVSQVYGEAYEVAEAIPETYPQALTRLVSVGGAVLTTNTYQLFESGNVDWFNAVVGAFGGGQALRLRANPPSSVGHLAGLGIALQYTAAGGLSGIPTDALAVDNTTGLMSLLLAFANIAGENVAAGAIGVPVLPGLTQASHITVTTQQTILTYTPAITGTYRISCYARINNAVTPNNVKFQATYTDPDTSTAVTLSLLSAASGGFFSGSNAVANGEHPMVPIPVRAAAGVAITVIYQDPTNTPSDFVTAFVERIA